MRCELPTDRMHPAVKIYKLSADLNPAEPEFIHLSDTYDDDLDPLVLIIVGGLADKRSVDTAVDLARERKLHTITVAVMTVDHVSCEIEEDFCCFQLKELEQAFNSIFLINERETDDFIKLIAHAIIIPGSPGQHMCCDWNDMRTILGGEKSSGLGRYGVGRGRGEARASQAVQAALIQLNQQEN